MSDYKTPHQMFADKIEERIRSQPIKQIDQYVQPGEFIYPAYKNLSLTNISATLLKLFNIQIPGHPALPNELVEGQTEGIRKVVLFLIDALGYNQLTPVLDSNPDLILNELIRRGRFAPLTSVFPSTTVAALTSIQTGMTPQEHGILGYRLFLKEYATVAEMIGFSSVYESEANRLVQMGLEPQRLLGVKTVFQRLANAQVPSYVLIKNAYRGSSLSQMFHQGAKKVHGFVNSSDMFVTLRRLIKEKPDERACIFVYWDAIDAIAHLYGANSEEFVAEVRNLSYSLERELIQQVDSQISGTTLLILTADHGQITAPRDRHIPVDRFSAIKDNLLFLPTGDYRAAYLHAKQGKRDRLRTYLRDRFSDQLIAIDSQKALSLGLWGHGELDEHVCDRMGDLLVVMRDNNVFYAPVTDRPYATGGRHGGLTPDEMLVPFLCVRLG